MIAEAVLFLRDELEAHLRHAPQSGLFADTAPVAMRNLFDYRGESVAIELPGLSLTVVHIEEEVAARKPMVQRETAAGFETGPAPLHLNLLVLIVAEIKPSAAEQVQKEYLVALRRVARTLQFFQARPSFSPKDSPRMPLGLSKLVVHQMNLTMQEHQNLWAYLGARYMPSVLYKVSMVSIFPDRVGETIPYIQEPVANLRPT